jgi:hypothetical protein
MNSPSTHPFARALAFIAFILLSLAPLGSAQDITSLSFPSRGTLKPAFNKDIKDYILEVETSHTFVNLRIGGTGNTYRINGGDWKTVVAGNNRVDLTGIETTLEARNGGGPHYTITIRKPYTPGYRYVEKRASMQYPRRSHSASLLPDGKVMVVGGVSTGSTYAPVEIYDPAADQWSLGPELPARYGHIQATLPDGRILVAGGWNGLTKLTDAYLFNQTTGLWTEVGSLHTAFNQGATTVVLNNGKVLVFNGANAELFDPITETWSVASEVPYPSDGASATTLTDGRILVAGGQPLSPGGNATSAAKIYDPATDEWTITTQMPIARAYHSASLMEDGKVLLASGLTLPSGFAPNSSIYDPATATWSSATAMNLSRYTTSQATAADGSIMIFGGGSYPSTLINEIYHPDTGTWTKGHAYGPMPSQMRSVALTGDRHLFIGGFVGNPSLTLSANTYSWETADTSATVSEGSEPLAPNSTLIFDDTLIQNSTTKTLTITNTGTQPLELSVDSIITTPVTTMYVTTDLYHTEPAVSTLAPGTSTTIDVTYTPWRDLNTATATLYITTRVGSEHPVSIPIFLQGTALSGSPLYEAWEETVGFTGDKSGPNASFHSDGVDNLLKYAFNLATDRPDTSVLTPGGTSGLPLITFHPAPSNGKTIRVEYLRRKGAGLLYYIHYTPDLLVYNNLTATETVTPINETWERVVAERILYNKTVFVRVTARMP